MKGSVAAQLAIHGGQPIRSRPFPAYRTIGEEEKKAVLEVLESGVLSDFLGTHSPQFYGGPRIQNLNARPRPKGDGHNASGHARAGERGQAGQGAASLPAEDALQGRPLFR